MLFNRKCAFFIACKFLMLFNGKFASCHFPMLFNGKFAFCHLPILFNENLRIEKVQGERRTYGRMDVQTDGRKEIHPCILQDIGPLGLLPKKGCYSPCFNNLKNSLSFEFVFLIRKSKMVSAKRILKEKFFYVISLVFNS